MKLSRNVVALALSTSVFFVSCGDGSSRNTLYYSNYTHADTEGYEFLKTVAEEADFQQLAAGGIGNSTLANEIKSTYSEVGQELHALSSELYVLTPSFAALEENSAQVSAEQIIHSQEVIVMQLSRVSENTNTKIADYARKTLPKLEALLQQTKSAK